MIPVRVHATLLLVLGNALLSHQTYQDVNKTMIFKWKTPEFEYPSAEARDEAIQQKRFVPTNVLVLDADYYAPTGRYFVTLPPFRPGVPANLAEVIGEQGLLRPFPRWPKFNETSQSLSCNGPHSVFRIYIDRCGLMWSLDSGQSATDVDFKIRCPPKLSIYNLNEGDREILRYKFPTSDYTERSTLTTFVVESYRKDCSDSFVYVADEKDHGLIVFDYAQKKSWRLEDPSFFPWPNHHLFDVNGVHYSVMAGIFALALGPIERERKLYYHAFASVVESWIPLEVLKNETVARRDILRGPAVVNSPGERAAQSTVEVMTDDGVLIYHLLPMNALVCWNSQTPFTSENQHILERDDVNFQYISGLKLKDNNLFIASCRYQNFLYFQENATDFNYRVMVIEDVKSLIANTPCANSQQASGYASAGFENTNYVGGSVGSANNLQQGSGFESNNYIGRRLVVDAPSTIATSVNSAQAVSGAGHENGDFISSRFGASPNAAVSGYSSSYGGGYAGGPNSVLSDTSYPTAGSYQSANSYGGYPHGFQFVGSFGSYPPSGDWSVNSRR